MGSPKIDRISENVKKKHCLNFNPRQEVMNKGKWALERRKLSLFTLNFSLPSLSFSTSIYMFFQPSPAPYNKIGYAHADCYTSMLYYYSTPHAHADCYTSTCQITILPSMLDACCISGRSDASAVYHIDALVIRMEGMKRFCNKGAKERCQEN